MAARPPTGGTEEPDAIEFGIAALDARLDETELQFPATAEEVRAAVRNAEVPYDASGHTVTLDAALAETDADRFETRTELLDELHPVFERRRRRGGGPIARLRDLLPF
ncbi:hypothetical protein GCM10027435_01570 [Haloparvum alkalitolerans]|uniref:DUF5789 family protein n=1 Tax=Haloparvum alkalitolerans TaxID=1042953 RepID=UPI003CF8B7E4